MSAKFTPGPWGEKAIAAALRAAHKHDGSWIDEIGDGENMPDGGDAHLIAAAPEMYEAITRCIAELERASSMGINIVPVVIETACEALRKARGEA